MFECSLLKIVRGTPAPNWVCATKPLSFSNACKNLSQQRPVGAEIWSSQKTDLGGSESACSTLLLVERSSPTFFAERVRNRPQSHVYIFWISLSVPEIFAIELWSGLKSNQILHVFGSQLFRGRGGGKFWDTIYHGEESSDNVSKFCGDWPTELEISWRNKKKKRKKETSAVKHKTTGYYHSGWPKK